VQRAWLSVEGKDGIRYRIDRQHPVVRHANEIAGEDVASIEAMLRVIEETVPVQRIWLDTTENGEAAAGGFASGQRAEIEQVIAVVYRNLRRHVGLEPAMARTRLLQTEPFNRFPDLVADLPDEPPV
jgi:hypothetical protein